MNEKINPNPNRSDDALAWKTVYHFAKNKGVEWNGGDMSTEMLLEKIWEEAMNRGFESGYEKHNWDMQEQR